MIWYSVFICLALAHSEATYATTAKALMPNSTTETSPSPLGDTKMGADAAATGTDIQDQKIQEEEEAYTPTDVGTKSPYEKNELEENQTDIKSY